jgi:peptidoglycan/LPS O-acetylase OafA/YrhL
VEPLSGVYWTLTYELFFYVYCGVLFSAKLLYVPRISGIFGIALTMIAVGFGNEDFSFFAYLLLGHLLRLAGQDDTRGARGWAGALMVALLVADANLAARVQYDPLFSPTALFVAMTAPVLGFLLAARMRRIAITPLLWLGSISYSIYLFHGLVLAGLAFLAVPAPLLFAASVIAGTLASAALVYKVVEKPFITLGRKGRVALPTAQAI